MQWTLRYDKRPVSMNAERKMMPYARAAFVKEWREMFWALSLEQQLPRYIPEVRIVVTPFHKDRRGRQDPANCLPSAKAAIDGIVDAHVIKDDTGEFIESITFMRPIIGRGDGMEVVIIEASDGLR